MGAGGVGFEPTVRLLERLFSKQFRYDRCGILPQTWWLYQLINDLVGNLVVIAHDSEQESVVVISKRTSSVVCMAISCVFSDCNMWFCKLSPRYVEYFWPMFYRYWNVVRGVKLKHNSKLSLVNLLCKYLSHQFYKYDLHIFITADEFNATGSRILCAFAPIEHREENCSHIFV